MIFRKLGRILITLATFSVPVVSSANESAIVSPEEGYWGGVFHLGSSKIQFQITAVDGIGSLQVEARGWQGLDVEHVYNCHYVFATKNMKTIEMFQNETASFNPNVCLADFPMEFKREEDNALKVIFDEKISTLIGLSEATLQSSFRPLREEDRNATDIPLDVLGVAPGMTKIEISEVLTGAGFTLSESFPEAWKADTYVVSQDIWNKKGRLASGGRLDGSPADEIAIVYTATKSWLPEEERAVTVRRGIIPGTTKGLTISSFQNAIKKKYGQTIGSYGNKIFFLRDGAVHIGAHGECGKGSLQGAYPKSPSLSTRNLNEGISEISLYCAGLVWADINEDQATGLIESATISVVSVDEMWDDFWKTWSKGEFDKIERILTALRASGDGPDL